MKPLIRFGALSLTVILAACNANGTGPGDALTDLLMDRDLALQAADAAAQDIELMGGSGGPLGIGLAAAADDDHAPFRCGTHEREHLTVARTCTFKDAAGNTQNGYDPNTTASAAIHVEIEGEITREHWSASVERTRDLTVTGLAGQETSRTWNGAGTGSSTRERHNDEGKSRQYDVSSTLAVTNVVIPVPRGDETWPLSGTITKQATITVVGGPNDGKTRQRTVTITFNGTRFVPITVNEHSFTFDLKTRRIVRDE